MKKLNWSNKECDCQGAETFICVFRGETRECRKPKNRIPYDYGYCPHQVWEKEEEGGQAMKPGFRGVYGPK